MFLFLLRHAKGYTCHGVPQKPCQLGGDVICCQCVVIVGGVAVEEFEIGKGCCQENIMIVILVSLPIDSDDMCLFLSEASCPNARHMFNLACKFRFGACLNSNG